MASKKEHRNYQDFIRQFDKGTVKSLYLFQGQEHFLIEEAIAHVKQTLIQSETADFNYGKFSGNDVQIGDLLDQVQTIPFLSKWRLIVLTDVHEIATPEQNRMIPYLSDPNQTTCLIMTAEKLDSRKKFAQALKQHAEIVQFWKLYDRDLPQWISRRAKLYDCTIPLQAATYLVDLVGNDLRQLDNELKKIVAYTG